MFALVVRFEVREDSIDAFDALIRETLEGIRELEAGTLLYFNARVDDAPASRVFVEVYSDEAAFRAHEGHRHTRRFLAERAGLIESYRVEVLDPVDGKFPAW